MKKRKRRCRVDGGCVGKCSLWKGHHGPHAHWIYGWARTKKDV